MASKKSSARKHRHFDDVDDDDNSSASSESTTMKVIINQEKAEQEAMSKSVSFLSADAIRWMNKRKANANSSMTAHVTPARALQLREIFKGLDFDGSGSIDIEELSAAVEYVAKADKNDPIFKDPRKLTEFFMSMDIDGNGSVDFNEFLIGMTSGQADQDETAAGTAKLQQAFFDFANMHRRQKIIDKIADKEVSDTDKLNDMRHLFKINYFKDEVFDSTVAEQITRAKQEATKNLKEIKSVTYRKQKALESKRSREGFMFFESKKSIDAGRNLIQTSLEDSKIPDSRYRGLKIDEKIRQSFSQFSLHNEHTFVPEQTQEQKNKLKTMHMAALSESKAIKSQKYQKSNSQPILPPVSMKNKTVTVPDRVTSRSRHRLRTQTSEDFLNDA